MSDLAIRIALLSFSKPLNEKVRLFKLKRLSDFEKAQMKYSYNWIPNAQNPFTYENQILVSGTQMAMSQDSGNN